ncbi:hypothetical protein C8J55DRAFT_508793 [Lentinula edodes]|uniref:Uncharacterized protein n=1 Tax=Lentinula lateritia TaxID=40482 RepID=A0A9W9AMJ9_9AGAR|nr:hypothetical protein C8J55DRAFT_508793 [Lentinula edodes]
MVTKFLYLFTLHTNPISAAANFRYRLQLLWDLVGAGSEPCLALLSLLSITSHHCIFQRNYFQTCAIDYLR